ncbi:MAG: hypothetical protein AAFV46_10995, partial [Cyanobacteria bacterium J06635_11]
ALYKMLFEVSMHRCCANPDEVIVTIGLEDIVVVRDGNATLIVKKDRTQEIKQAVRAIGQEDQFQHLL